MHASKPKAGSRDLFWIAAAAFSLLMSLAFLFFSHNFWQGEGPASLGYRLMWTLLAFVLSTLASVLTRFLSLLQNLRTEISESVKRLERYPDTLGDRLFPTVHSVVREAIDTHDASLLVPHIVPMIANPTKLGHYSGFCRRMIHDTLDESFARRRMWRHQVTPEHYCVLLQQACHLAKKSIGFTCLESPFWFMQGADVRRIHLDAIEASSVKKANKIRIVILDDALSDVSLREEGNANPAARAADTPQLQGVIDRDLDRLKSGEKSEIHWFERRSERLTLYWTLARLVASRGALLQDYGLFDNTVLISYDFANGILSCSWDDMVVEEASRIFELAHEPSALGTCFFPRFWQLPGVPASLAEEYVKEDSPAKPCQ